MEKIVCELKDRVDVMDVGMALFEKKFGTMKNIGLCFENNTRNNIIKKEGVQNG